MRYSSWYTEWDDFFFVILGYFLPFYHPNNLENQNFEKMEKIPKETSSFYTSVP